MLRRNPLPACSIENIEAEEPIWPGRSSFFHLVGRLVLGATVIAGLAVVLAPVLSEQAGEPPRADVIADHIQHVQAGAFSADGTIFATCGVDQFVRLWDAKPLAVGSASPPVILADDTVKYSVAFSPDGSLIGAVGPQSLTIWSARSGQYVPVFRKQLVASSCLAFSPDGQTLAVGSDDGEVSLHDIGRGEERAVLHAHTNVVRSGVFARRAFSGLGGSGFTDLALGRDRGCFDPHADGGSLKPKPYRVLFS